MRLGFGRAGRLRTFGTTFNHLDLREDARKTEAPHLWLSTNIATLPRRAMVRHGTTVAPSLRECQKRCIDRKDCEHFTAPGLQPPWDSHGVPQHDPLDVTFPSTAPDVTAILRTSQSHLENGSLRPELSSA